MNHLFVAGFDFGTSYSKVVLRDRLTNVAKVVTFGPGDNLALFPSYLRVLPEGLAGPESDAPGLIVSYPKLIATDAASASRSFAPLYADIIPKIAGIWPNPISLRDFAPLLLTRYFLSVIDGIHAFIRRDEEWGQYSPEADPLIVQLAVPIGLNQADNECEKLMQRCLAAATWLRRQAAPATPVIAPAVLGSALAEVDRMDAVARDHLNLRCITYPEVAAGVQAVLRSPNTPDGKYITLDVGAGTVDINAFLRHQRGTHSAGDGLEYWACEVHPLGFARLDLPGGDFRQQHERTVNPMAPDDLFGKLEGAVGELMKKAFRYQPNRVVGGGGQPWRHRTYAYIWGGGAEHAPYQAAFARKLEACGVKVPGITRIPRPNEHFHIPADVNFGRLAIAYGLSFHEANLEDVRLPHELQTFEDRYPFYWHEAMAAERACTCRGNPECPRCFGLGQIRRDAAIAPAILTAPRFTQEAPAPARNRYSAALEARVRQYEELSPRTFHLVERLLLLNRIQILRMRPEIDPQSHFADRAGRILQHNMATFRRRVKIVPMSGIECSEGCRCVVLRKDQNKMADLIIRGDPEGLTRKISRHQGHNYVDLVCAIAGSLHDGFHLKAEPDPRRGRSRRGS